MRRLCTESPCPYPGRSVQHAIGKFPVLSHWLQQARRAGLIILFEQTRWQPIAPAEATPRGDWTEVSRGHSSCTTKVINGREVVSKGPNIDDKEETDSLRAMQPSGDSPYLATESLTSFEP